LATLQADAGPETFSWREELAPYARPDMRLSALDLATSVLPYVALTVAIYFSLQVSVLLALALAVPAAGFLLRTYIIFHDCTHGSFMGSKRANSWLGMATGMLVYSNYQSWRHNHAIHHATAGDLDRRGTGDVPTMTVEEYNSGSRGKRIAYWLFRHPLVLFTLGPIWSLVVSPRLVSKNMRPRIKRAVWLTNVAVVVMVGALVLLMGWRDYFLTIWPAAWLAGSAGVFMFYVQHQFEDVYWENTDNWSYDEAALRGSSYLKLPKVLQFFTGNIGLHHVHHLSARIPNYNLQRAHDDHDVFHTVPTLTLLTAIRTVRLKLWDAQRGRLVTFSEARAMRGVRNEHPVGASAEGA
jgi:omega-6 fatty acid desaturase (delta-12 desaturase)